MQELGAKFESSSDIPAGMEEDIAKWREALIDAAVELDDAAMEAYLEVTHRSIS
jgi:elongation factor G